MNLIRTFFTILRLKVMQPIDKRDFKGKEKEAFLSSSLYLRDFNKIYWEGVRVLRAAIDLLISENNISEDRHVTAILLLVSRSVQHLESMRLLMERGLYGDSFALMRGVMSDLAMMQYLRLKPDLVETFLKESQKDYQDKKSDFKSKFNETAIHKALVASGVPPFKSSFDTMSKFNHASAFGAQIYARRGKDGTVVMKYGPGFELEKLIALSGTMIAGHFDLLDNILLYRANRTPGEEPGEEWSKVESASILLNTKVVALSLLAESFLKKHKRL